MISFSDAQPTYNVIQVLCDSCELRGVDGAPAPTVWADIDRTEMVPLAKFKMYYS
jgi:hypothetical protein